jgi:two-component system, OmpR family, sensor histidine kinase KdpD
LFRRSRPLWRCLAGCSFLAVLTYAGYVLHANLTAISFTYLLLVLAMALFCGFWEASFVSVLAVGCLDYFFTPPVFQFDITDAQDWIALGSFEVAAVLISRLTARELRAAREASVFRAGMERLYELSRNSLLLDLRKPPGPQLVVLIQGVFAADAVALFDRNRASQDKVGDWKAGEENLAKEGYLEGVARDHPETRTYQRLLRIGSESVGALAVRGDLSPLVADALSSLAAIAIERHRSFEHEERAETVSKSEQLRAAVMDALAHEIKTPLTAVQTASSGLLELGGLTETQRGLITLIDGEATRLNQLCSRLLLTAKLEAHQVGLQITQVNVGELIADVLSDKATKADRNSVSVAVPDPTLTVSADRGLLAMMLAQYIENARKYSTPATSIDITARRSHSEVLISVRNWGPKIPIEDRERIFERFYRSPVQNNSVAGTGIGLSVVRKAAEAHHGHVWVVSDDQQGTTFFVSLPVGVWRMQ